MKKASSIKLSAFNYAALVTTLQNKASTKAKFVVEATPLRRGVAQK